MMAGKSIRAILKSKDFLPNDRYEAMTLKQAKKDNSLAVEHAFKSVLWKGVGVFNIVGGAVAAAGIGGPVGALVGVSSIIAGGVSGFAAGESHSKQSRSARQRNQGALTALKHGRKIKLGNARNAYLNSGARKKAALPKAVGRSGGTTQVDSSGRVFVDGFTRSNGARVKGHYRNRK